MWLIVKLGRGLLNKLKTEIPITKVILLVLLSSYLLWKVVETLHGISGLLVWKLGLWGLCINSLSHEQIGTLQGDCKLSRLVFLWIMDINYKLGIWFTHFHSKSFSICPNHIERCDNWETGGWHVLDSGNLRTGRSLLELAYLIYKLMPRDLKGIDLKHLVVLLDQARFSTMLIICFVSSDLYIGLIYLQSSKSNLCVCVCLERLHKST